MVFSSVFQYLQKMFLIGSFLCDNGVFGGLNTHVVGERGAGLCSPCQISTTGIIISSIHIAIKTGKQRYKNSSSRISAFHPLLYSNSVIILSTRLPFSEGGSFTIILSRIPFPSSPNSLRFNPVLVILRST